MPVPAGARAGLGECDLVAFIAATDLQKARTFYCDLLGLRLVSETPFALELDAHGTMLRVTVVQQVQPAPYTVLGWRVGDIQKTLQELEGNGIRFEQYPGLQGQDERGIWSAPGGAKVAWFHDPFGHTLSVTQS